MPAITAIVPTYNRAALLTQCLESLLAQSRPLAEIIVIDDGSTDDTPQAVAALDGPIRYIRQDNTGKPRALNRALPLVETPWVWIFDDDDIALPDAVACHAAVQNAEPRPAFTYSPFYFAHDDGSGAVRRGAFNPIPEGPPCALLSHLLLGCCISLQSVVFSLDAGKTAGAFVDDMYRAEDYDFMLRLARRHPAAAVAAPTYLRRIHPGPRGGLHDPHAAADHDARFYGFERRLFETIYCDFTPEEYLPPGTRPDTLRCLVRRLTVMARKGVWHRVVEDAQALSALAPSGPFDPAEKRDLMHALERPFVARDLSGRAEIITALANIARQPGPGQDAVHWLSASLARTAWREAAAGRRTEARAILATAFHLGGIHTLPMAMRGKAIRA